MAIHTWEELIQNKRVIILCDNQSVVEMVNHSSSKCKQCMVLIRMLVLNNLCFNRRISVRYIRSEDNILSDSLSRGRLDIFWFNAPIKTRKRPDDIPEQFWPVEKLWI